MSNLGIPDEDPISFQESTVAAVHVEVQAFFAALDFQPDGHALFGHFRPSLLDTISGELMLHYRKS
jgi:hypothetical protein